MKGIFLLASLLFSIIIHAQNTILSGKWREISRKDPSGVPVKFLDTIKMEFTDNNDYTWVRKGGFNYRGTYKLENEALDLGSRYYRIISQDTQRIVLSDDAVVYEFVPYKEIQQGRLSQLSSETMLNSLDKIRGNWEVFKGTSSATMKTIDVSSRVRSLMIYDLPDTAGHLGHILASRDREEAPSWYIYRFDNGKLYARGKSNRVFKIMLRDDELIIREGNFTYHLKQF